MGLLDTLRQTVDSVKEVAESAGGMALDTLLSSDKILGLANSKIDRYAHIRSISKTEKGFEIAAQINGSSETVAVCARQLDIKPDGSAVALRGLSANIKGIENLLQDVAEGRYVPIPENFRGIVSKIHAMLG